MIEGDFVRTHCWLVLNPNSGENKQSPETAEPQKVELSPISSELLAIMVSLWGGYPASSDEKPD